MVGYIGPQPVPQATQNRETFTATASQTIFNTGGYTPGYIDVFLNGVKLVDTTDYTATNGSDVILTSGAAASDTLEVVAYTAFTVADQTFTGDIVMSDGLTVDNDGATVLTVDRATSDGTIIDVQKDGATVGSIGTTTNSYLFTSGTNSGIFFYNNGFGPSVGSSGNGALTDGTKDIGATANRFRDLYLSGGVFLGGTGASNLLDDYEEGTWTVTTNVGTITNNTGFYRKVGDLVYATAIVGNFSDITSSTEIQLSLPFTSSSSSINNHGSVMSRFIGISGESLTSFIADNSPFVNIYRNGTNSNNWSTLTYSDLTSTSAYLRFSISYMV